MTVKLVGETVEKEIERLVNGKTSHQNLTAISKSLNVIVKAYADSIRYSKERGEKPSIPFYEEV